MSEFFSNYSTLVLFLHVISAVIWIGGMIAIRFATHYSIQKVDDPKIKLEFILGNLKRFFNMVIPSIIILFLSAIIMILALNLNSTLLILKESIFILMTAIFILIFIKRAKAEKFFKNGDYKDTKNSLEPIAKYLIPINIILGLVELTLGVMLRGF